MLSKSAAKAFFLSGSALCFGAFFLLTVDTLRQVPEQTKGQNLTEGVIEGKHIWEDNNCMGCHTIFGEGAYYAPELTKVYTRRGPDFIHAMLTDPEAMFPGERKMVKYDFTEKQKQSMIEFLKWIGEVDLNGFPPEPQGFGQNVSAVAVDSPAKYKAMCVACHSLGGKGGNVGPALDNVGDRMSQEDLVQWLTDPQKVKPGTSMPKLPMSEGEIVELASFLATLNGGK